MDHTPHPAFRGGYEAEADPVGGEWEPDWVGEARRGSAEEGRQGVLARRSTGFSLGRGQPFFC